MFDVVTVGSATKDVFLFTKQATLKQGIASHFLELPIDRKLEIDEKMEFTGGNATNTAATFANFGKRVAVIAKIGRDEAGDMVVSDLSKRGISTDYLVRADGETPFSTVLVSKMNKAVVLVYRGIEGTLEWDEINHEFDTKWMLIGPLPGESLDLLKSLLSFCKDNNIKVALNLGSGMLSLGIKKLAPLLDGISVISMNNIEARKFVGLNNEVKNLLELKKKADVAIITKGALGSMAADDKRIYYAGSMKANQINYIGAGDAFLSGFVNALIDEKSIEDAINLAAYNSSSVVQKYGAKTGLVNDYPKSGVKIESVEYKKR